MRCVPLLILSLVCLSSIRCGTKGGDITGPTQVASVRVSSETRSIAVTQTAEFTAEALDASGSVLAGKSFAFSSSNTAVATIVDPAANPATVTGVGPGFATITATTEGKNGALDLRVTAQPDIQVTGRVIDGESQVGLGLAVVNWEVADGGADQMVTGADGSFSFVVPFAQGEQTVDVTASATGYVSTTLDDERIAPPNTQLETILLVRQTSTKGFISGTVRNARTNRGIPGASIALIRGQGTTAPPLTRTTSDASSGGFTFTQLEAGTYTLYAGVDGFNPGTRTAIPVVSGPGFDQDIILSPFGESEIRIVLTWGRTPSDLDAHLTGPNPDGSRFHVYWPTGSQGGFFAPPFAGLDVDDVNAFGPETITITQLSPGTYRYSVHDFSNRGSATSAELAASGARVQLYTGAGIREYFVPNERGTLWTVFELSGNIYNPTVTRRNTMGLAEDPDGILLRTAEAVEKEKENVLESSKLTPGEQRHAK